MLKVLYFLMISEVLFELRDLLKPKTIFIRNVESDTIIIISIVICRFAKKIVDQTPLRHNFTGPALIGKRSVWRSKIETLEYITLVAERLYGVNTYKVLADVDNYQVKNSLWEKSFVWLVVENIGVNAWWNGIRSKSSQSKVATAITSMPQTLSSTERSFSVFSNIHKKNSSTENSK